MSNEQKSEWKDVKTDVWKAQKDGDSIEGVLVSKVEADGDQLSNRYYIENKDGINLVWGSTIIDSRMNFVEVGQKVKITFIEKTKNKKGQDLNIFKVQVADDDSIPEVA